VTTRSPIDAVRLKVIQIGKVWLQGWGIVDAEGNFILRHQIKRRYVFFQKLPPCLVDIEALCVVASLVARTPGALSHEVRLMPPV
jgi:transposase